MDTDNFKFKLDKWNVVMEFGVLTINDCEYEENSDDPTYDFVRFIFKSGLYD